MNATQLLAIVAQLAEGMVRSCGWISDGSSHDSKVVADAKLIRIEATTRGLMLHVYCDATSKHRRVCWRMTECEASMVVTLFASTRIAESNPESSIVVKRESQVAYYDPEPTIYVAFIRTVDTVRANNCRSSIVVHYSLA